MRVQIGNEETDLAAAIAASLGDTTASQQRNVVDVDAPSSSAAAAKAAPEAACTGGQDAANHGELGTATVTDSSAGVCELAVKLPSSARVVAQFGVAQKVDDVFAWLAALGWDLQRHRLCASYPRKVLQDAAHTLAEAGLCAPREMLVLEVVPGR